MRNEELLIFFLLAVLGVIFSGGICGIIALVKVIRLRRDHERLKRSVAQPGVVPEPIPEVVAPKERVPERPETPVVIPAPAMRVEQPSPKTVEAPPPLPQETPPLKASSLKKPFSMDEAMVMKVILWIGMTLLTIGVGFFMRYAYNNSWIGPEGRLAIGVLTGLAALGIGEHFRRKEWNLLFQIFSGGGFAIFYTCVFFSFQVYHLSGPLLSMALAILITIVAVLMAVAATTANEYRLREVIGALRISDGRLGPAERDAVPGCPASVRLARALPLAHCGRWLLPR